MGEKEIVKQYKGYIYYKDGSKETIADYRARMKKAPLKSDVEKILKKSREKEAEKK